MEQQQSPLNDPDLPPRCMTPDPVADPSGGRQSARTNPSQRRYIGVVAGACAAALFSIVWMSSSVVVALGFAVSIGLGMLLLPDHGVNKEAKSLIEMPTRSGWVVVALVTAAALHSAFSQAQANADIARTDQRLEIVNASLTEARAELTEARRQLDAAERARVAQTDELRSLLRDFSMMQVDLQTNSPFRRWVNFRVGNLFYVLRSMDEALHFYSLQLRYEPLHAPTLFNQGVVLSVLNRREEAQESFSRIPLDRLRVAARESVLRWRRALESSNRDEHIGVTTEDWKLWWFPTTGDRGGFPNP